MATYKKVLRTKNGDFIIPLIDVLDYLHPIGSIYMSTTMSTVSQVQNALGGTWVKWGTGCVPVGVDTSQTEFNTVGKTGGASTVTLTNNEMPSHSHRLSHPQNLAAGGNAVGMELVLNYDSGTRDNRHTEPIGGGGAHNNLQPYITCYMYKRVADSSGGASEPTNPGGKK